MSVERLGDGTAKHITAVVAGILLAGSAVGLAIAPEVNRDHPATELGGFFGTAAQVIAALVVALALFQSGPSPVAGHGARRFLSPWIFPVLGLGLVASVAGLSPALPTCLYAWIFGIVVGTGTSALASTLLVGAGNLEAQRKQGVRDRAGELDPDA